MKFACAAIFGASGGIGRALTERLAATNTHIWAGSRSGEHAPLDNVSGFQFDLEDEQSLRQAVCAMQSNPPDLVVVATGILTLRDGRGPERSYKSIERDVMEEVFRINTFGPALVAKHFLPLLPRDRRSVFAVLSARVGSIGDNRIGGWHSYRASKAALNMLIRNYAIELARTHKHAIVAGLHPGTVDTALSAPFQSNLPANQLATRDSAANNLLEVITSLSPNDSGKVFDWKGDEVPA